MLPLLLNRPETEQEFSSWSFTNADNHGQIIRLLAQQTSIDLTIYILDPISTQDVKGWLQRHQEAHNQMNSAFSQSGSDLSTVDFTDSEEFDSWLQLHFQEHFAISSLLGIG